MGIVFPCSDSLHVVLSFRCAAPAPEGEAVPQGVVSDESKCRSTTIIADAMNDAFVIVLVRRSRRGMCDKETAADACHACGRVCQKRNRPPRTGRPNHSARTRTRPQDRARPRRDTTTLCTLTAAMWRLRQGWTRCLVSSARRAFYPSPPGCQETHSPQRTRRPQRTELLAFRCSQLSLRPPR
jgi:hypothetical protein